VVTEYTGVNETAPISSGARVVGLRAGAIANRQLVIYDKCAEITQQNKMAWLPIWNAALEAKDKPPIDLTDRTTSQVWRFEMRLPEAISQIGKGGVGHGFRLRWFEFGVPVAASTATRGALEQPITTPLPTCAPEQITAPYPIPQSCPTTVLH